VFLYNVDVEHSTTVVRFSNNPIHHPSIFAGGFPGSKPNCDPPVVVAKGVTVPRLTNPLSTERHWEKNREMNWNEFKWNISSSKPSHTNIKRQRQVWNSFKNLQKLALTRECHFSARGPGFHVFLLGGGFIATLQLTKRLPVDDCWKYKHIPPKLQLKKHPTWNAARNQHVKVLLQITYPLNLFKKRKFKW